MKAKEPRIITFLLCLFFGPLGIHRFYLRKRKTATFMLLSLGGFGIWYLMDLALIVMGKLQRKEKTSFSLQRDR